MTQVLMPDGYVEDTENIELPDDILMPDDYSDTSTAKANAEVYKDTSPDQAARNINIAKKLDVELPLVESDPKYFEDKAKEPDYDLLGVSLNEYLTDMQNSSVSRDDTEALSQVEDIHTKHEEDGALYRGIQAIAKATPRGFTTISEGVNNALGLGFGVLDYAERGIGDLLRTGSTGVFGETRDYFQGLASENRATLQGDKTIAGLDLGVSDVIKDKRLIDNPDLLLSPEWMITQAGDAVSQFIPMIATAYFTGGSNLVAGTVGGVQEASSFYNDLITNHKATEDDALTGTLLFGAASTALNKIGVDAILAKKVVNTTLKRIGFSAIKGSVEAGTEYLEELTQGVIQALSENGVTDPDIGQKVKDGFLEAAKNIDVMVGAFMLGGGVSYTNTKVDYLKAKEAERFKETMDKMAEAIDNSKTKERSPEQVEKFLKTLGFGQEGYITPESAKVLFQENPDIIKKLGLDASILTDVEAGLDIEIDTKKYCPG